MTGAAIQPAQIRAIHAIKTRTRLDDASYRAMLQAYGAGSSKDLSHADAEQLLARMRDIPGASKPVERPSKAKASGGYAKKLQAMWIAAWNLGIVQDRTDGAMHAFLERQTGIPHTRFLRDPMDARRAIEALKGWIVREGEVVWPAPEKDRIVALRQMKCSILRAQWKRCIAVGAVTVFELDPYEGLTDFVSWVVRGGPRRVGAIEDATVTPVELDRASAALGRKLRQALSPKVEVRRAG